MACRPSSLRTALEDPRVKNLFYVLIGLIKEEPATEIVKAYKV